MRIILLATLCLGLLSTATVQAHDHKTDDKKDMKMEKTVQNVHSFTAKTIDGKERNLSDYEGKVLLIVNTASRCGYTGQYEGLQELYSEYKDQGFMVLGFPSNDYMGQEPGSNEEIKNFCKVNYGVEFDMFSKISTKGDEIHPLYKHLTTEGPEPGKISWNFNKFLVGKDGTVLARFGSGDKPKSDKVVSAIKEALAAK